MSNDPPPPPPAEHGTRSRYTAGCRCDPCTDANAHYQHQRRLGIRTARVTTRLDPMPWAVDAACRGYRTDLWFPVDDGGRTVEPVVIDRCTACPVRTDCLDYALRNDVDGIWAATTPAERRRLRKLHRITARPVITDDPPPHLETEAS